MYVNREYKQSPDLTEVNIISGVLVKASINKEDPLYTMRTTEVFFTCILSLASAALSRRRCLRSASMW